MMGLRRDTGIDLERLERMSGGPMSASKITELCDLGMLEQKSSRLAATLQGRLVLNAVIKSLMD
jgi:oxygen-independent coproporphyrinogen-3 oxidase